MTFSIQSVRFAEATDAIISASWRYTTDKGFLHSEHVFQLPAGSVPSSAVTEAVLISWLKQQLPETEEQMAASIAAERARRDEAASIVEIPIQPAQTVDEAAAEFHRLQAERAANKKKAETATPWDANTAYKLGDVVTHNGGVFEKIDEHDHSEPDDVPGGWKRLWW
jgi:hypothetical protein